MIPVLLSNFNNEKICICTGGDDQEVIENNINYFNSEKSTIAVSATRTKGDTKDLYDDFASKHRLEPIKIQKDDNLNFCRLYVSKLFQVISGKIDIKV